jgi:hypothetical protein
VLDSWTTSAGNWPERYNALSVRLAGCTFPVARLTWPSSPLAPATPPCVLGTTTRNASQSSTSVAIATADQDGSSLALGFSVAQDLRVAAVAIELLWTLDSNSLRLTSSTSLWVL